VTEAGAGADCQAASQLRSGATFDHHSPDLLGPAFWEAVGDLQRSGPLVWVENYGGYWAATSYETVRRVAQDWETFSSAQGVALQRPGPDVMPYILPIDTDPPRQRTYRQKVNPHLAPKAVNGLETAIRDIANELVDAFVERGACDIAVEFARRFPGTVFFRLMVHTDDEDFQQVEPSARMLSFDPDKAKKAEASANLRAWASKVFALRRAEADRPDVVSAVMHLEDSGESFAEHELYSGLQILAQGGIGTSANLIGSIVLVLCERPDLQDRVRRDPRLVPALIEEVLRLEPPAAMLFRTATRDVEIAGQKIRKGDKVGLFFGAANRDPAVFERPDEVDIDRPRNPHLSFGVGVHRCVGSNLARLQVRVAIEQLLVRLSPFRLPEGAKVQYASDLARGPCSLPLEFTAGPRVEERA
jgi:cytochrome P450